MPNPRGRTHRARHDHRPAANVPGGAPPGGEAPETTGAEHEPERRHAEPEPLEPDATRSSDHRGAALCAPDLQAKERLSWRGYPEQDGYGLHHESGGSRGEAEGDLEADPGLEAHGLAARPGDLERDPEEGQLEASASIRRVARSLAPTPHPREHRGHRHRPQRHRPPQPEAVPARGGRGATPVPSGPERIGDVQAHEADHPEDGLARRVVDVGLRDLEQHEAGARPPCGTARRVHGRPRAPRGQERPMSAGHPPPGTRGSPPGSPARRPHPRGAPCTPEPGPTSPRAGDPLTEDRTDTREEGLCLGVEPMGWGD